MKKKNLPLLTAMLMLAMVLSYIQESTLSPVLMDVKDTFLIEKDAQLNLLSTVYFILGFLVSFLVPKLDMKVGTRHVLTTMLILLVAGSVLCTLSSSWLIFLISRCITGAAMGVAVSFNGNAVDRWYNKKDREWMNTISGFLPFIGTLSSFAFVALINYAFGNWRAVPAVWAVVGIILIVIWILMPKENFEIVDALEAEAQSDESILKLFIAVLKNKGTSIMSVLYMLDLMTYIYIVLILPTYIFERSNGAISETVASTIATLYPIAAIIGTVIGGTLSTKLGRRKPSLILAAVCKLLGLFLMAYSKSPMAIVLIGMIVYGNGSGLWMQPLYSVPMEVGLSKPEVATAFSLFSITSSLGGIIAPSIGGAIADYFVAKTSLVGVDAHVYGMSNALMILNITCVASLILSFIIPETGPKKRK